MKEKQLTSNELLRKAKERSGLSQEVLRQSLHALLGAISEVMDDGKGVVLDNFGSFDLRTVKEHTVTPPPPNNTPTVVPEHQVVRFKPYKNILIYHMKY
jgi:nucleoid DNA-binding protein